MAVERAALYAQAYRLMLDQSASHEVLGFYLNYLMRWLCLWRRLVRWIRTFTTQRLQR